MGSRRRSGGVIGALLLTLVATAGCAAGSPGQGAPAASDQSAQTVATGNTLDQQVPTGAATTPLVDANGHRFDLRSLHGKIVVLAPLLTFCQETCPMTSANMHRAAQAAQRDGRSDHVVFLEVTVDPQRDTVSRTHAYTQLYGALPDWRLATGSPAAVTALWKQLGVSTDKTRPDETVVDWMTGKVVHHSYDVHHQDVVMIVDPTGRLRWITVGHPDARGTALPTSLQQFLDADGKQNYAHPDAGGASSWTSQDLDQAVAYVAGLKSDG